MAPLVDVVFLLLVFFLLTSSFIRLHTLDMVMAGPVRETEVAAAMLIVRIDTNEVVTLDGMTVHTAQIAPLVADRLRAEPGLAAVLITDFRVRLQATVMVLEQLQTSGIQDVRIGVKP